MGVGNSLCSYYNKKDGDFKRVCSCEFKEINKSRRTISFDISIQLFQQKTTSDEDFIIYANFAKQRSYSSGSYKSYIDPDEARYGWFDPMEYESEFY